MKKLILLIFFMNFCLLSPLTFSEYILNSNHLYRMNDLTCVSDEFEVNFLECENVLPVHFLEDLESQLADFNNNSKNLFLHHVTTRLCEEGVDPFLIFRTFFSLIKDNLQGDGDYHPLCWYLNDSTTHSLQLLVNGEFESGQSLVRRGVIIASYIDNYLIDNDLLNYHHDDDSKMQYHNRKMFILMVARYLAAIAYSINRREFDRFALPGYSRHLKDLGLWVTDVYISTFDSIYRREVNPLTVGFATGVFATSGAAVGLYKYCYD